MRHHKLTPLVNNAMRERGFAYISILGLLLACISGSQYLLTGSLTDVWIPLLSAKAMADGMTLYTDWHSPLGIVYHGLHYGAYLLIQAYPASLHQLDQLLLASMGFTALLGAVFTICRYGFRARNAFPDWILLLSISTACQLRAIGQLFHPFALVWSGAYNNQGWALLMMIYALIIHWQQYPSHQRMQQTHDRFTIGLAIATTIGLHMKITIGLTLLLWSLVALAEKPRWLYGYGLTLLSLHIALHQLYPPLWGYWYDIAYMLNHAHPQGLPMITQCSALILSILALCYLHLPPIPAASNASVIDRIHQRWQALRNTPYCVITQKSLYAIGILITIRGESQAALGYYALILGLSCAVDRRYRIRAFVGKTGLGAFFLCNLLSLGALALYKHQPLPPGTAFIPLDNVQHTGGFVVDNARGLSHLAEYVAHTARTYDPMRIAISAPTPPMAFHNLDYATMIQQAHAAIASRSHNPQDTVVMLGFTNPLPLLLQRPLPLSSWHWLDFAVNLSPDHLDDLVPLYQQTDFLYLPLVAFDDSGDPGYQRRFTQHFLQWNRIQQRFILVDKQPLGLLYASQATMQRNHPNT
jgi:hypothetical protein